MVDTSPDARTDAVDPGAAGGIDGSAVPHRLAAEVPHRARARRPPMWLDRMLGSDPGLTRLRTALQAAVTIGAAMLVEWWFARAEHPLFLSAGDPALASLPAAARTATLSAQHHGLTVIAIMLGAIVGLISTFGAGMFTSRRQLVVCTALIPVPMTAGLAVGLCLGDYRTAALALLVVVLGLGGYARRFGPAGFLGGQLAFMGAFFGFNLHGQIQVSGIGWLVAEIAIGAAVALVAQFTVFFPSRSGALRRMVRSYAAREREVAAFALDLFDHPDDGGPRRRLHRRLTRLNETALMIDAHLATPGSIPAHWVPSELHQRLFDSELSLTNVARFAERLADLARESTVPVESLRTVREALVAVEDVDLLRASHSARRLIREVHGVRTHGRHEDPASFAEPERVALVVLHRFAMSVLGFVEAAEGWRVAVLTGAPGEPVQPFATEVTLFGGWLPGSSGVSAAASLEAGARRSDRITLQPYTRIAIQISVAATLAIVLGSLVSEKRFYWAVIAAFVTFMGANNAGEQLRKGFFRVVGTVAGVFLGAVAVHFVGRSTGLAIAVILVALFLGLYLMRISYAFMTIGITVMVSQLYVQLDEFSNSLLLLRLGETAIGAAAAALTVLLVVPLRTGRVVRVATRQYVQALAAFVQAAVARLGDPAHEIELRDAARQIDSAWQALSATLIPLMTPVVGQPDALRKRIVHAVTASRHYARNLVVDARTVEPVGEQARAALAPAGERLLCSLDEVVEVGNGAAPEGHTYVRAAALFELVAAELNDPDFTSPAALALKDLQLIDGAMASLAEGIGMPVRALDTDDDAPTEPSSTAAAAVAI